MTSPLAKRLAWGLVALCLVLLGCGLALDAAKGSGMEAGAVFSIALTVTLLPVGVLVTRRQPANPIGWMFLGVALSLDLGVLAAGYADYWTSGEGGSEGLGKSAAWYASSSWAPWVLIPATFLLLLFPDGRLLPGRRWRIAAWCAGLGIALTWLGSLLHPGKLQDYPSVRNPYGLENGLADPLGGLGFLLVAVGLVGSIAAVVLRFRRGDREQREQIKWIALAGAAIAVIVPLGIATYDLVGEDVANTAIEVSILGLPIAAGVAILRYRLYEIDVVINRTLVYATLTAGLAAVFAAVALGLGVAIGSGSTVPTAAATLAVALLFRPLRGRVQTAVDRRFDRARYEGLRTVDRFLAELRAGRAAPEKAAPVLAEALGDPDLELLFWLPEEDVHVDASGRTVSLPGAPGRARTPVRRGDLQLATVIHDEALARRPNLLDSILAAAGLAIEVGRLRAEVRRRLAEVEDSRDAYRHRRLRGAAPARAGPARRRPAAAGLDRAGPAARPGPAAAPSAEARELVDVRRRTREAIDELRELARGVRPAGLDDGLATALQALASRAPSATRVEATRGALRGPARDRRVFRRQ